jgi:hypothetical protein
MRFQIILMSLLAASCGASTPEGGTDTDGGDAAGPGDGGTNAGPDARTIPVSRVEGYIRSDTFGSLVLEIDSVAGSEPRAAVEADVVSGLDSLLDKPNGITAIRDGAILSRGSNHAWTFAELQELASEHFDLAVSGDTTKIHAMFVDGHSADDANGGKILGLAWSNQHLVMFKQSIESTCGGAGVPVLIRDRLCAGAELSIWIHEIGHVIGLVDAGLPMVVDHKDEAHGAHDEDDGCVMYWAYDGEAVIDTLQQQILAGGAESLGFDDACRADIEAVRSAVAP